ncbi:hypothetical protein [Nonomuraea fuscirosea]|uniref:hypothetical protein n=1 Tax=Nonomuraea fuscirosea TaxID=1291556 RepID=UPI0033CC99DE
MSTQTSPSCQTSGPYRRSVSRVHTSMLPREDRQPGRLPEHVVVAVEQRMRAGKISPALGRGESAAAVEGLRGKLRGV